MAEGKREIGDDGKGKRGQEGLKIREREERGEN